ncbi:hypothetical protein AVEN_41877-1 [Araneus ventricosus]|uniref:Uncharacterized protein n=1 Tax=Araneus ventricosus TaxID=182803 RepID=A0A4Y2ACA8_ARAVE|nr:hypothetical protein AVEN_41877-1 [Araneus ventricosus]
MRRDYSKSGSNVWVPMRCCCIAAAAVGQKGEGMDSACEGGKGCPTELMSVTTLQWENAGVEDGHRWHSKWQTEFDPRPPSLP